MNPFDSMVVEFNLVDRSYKNIQLAEIDFTFPEKAKIYWFHVNLDQPDSLKKMAEKLQLTDEVIKLSDPEDTMPKLIDSGESLTLKIQCLKSTGLQVKDRDNYENLIIHLTSNYCLTMSKSPLPALITFTESYAKTLKYAKTPCFILFLLLDNVINDYSNILYEYELRTDKIDLHIRKSSRNRYNDVMHTKKKVMKTERHAAAIRDILMRISGRKISVISKQCRMSLGNLFGHSQMIVGEAEAIREILNGILDQIDNAIMNKMGESMKLLTAFAAIFLPLTLIAGIYGMNFEWMPELKWKYGYFSVLFTMIFIGCILYLLFKKKKWF